MKLLITTLSVVALAFTVQADLGDASKLPPAAKKTVDFDKDIKPIFEKSCVKCHSGEKPKGKYSMETKEGIMKEAVKGDSAKSELVHLAADLVVDSEMPPLDKRDKYPALTKDQIGLIRAWIDQGAK
jgi:uncharacterized membrane protein